MDEALYGVLTGEVALTALVPATQIGWGRLPQSTPYPQISMHIISGAEGATLTGPDGLWRGRVQIDVFAPDRAQARQIARMLVSLLHAVRVGPLTSFLISERDQGAGNAVGRPAHVSLDFNIIWKA